MAEETPQPNVVLSFFVENEDVKASMEKRKVKAKGNGSGEAETMSWNWRDTMRDAHKQAFVVAKMAKADMLDEVQKSLKQAQSEGWSYEQWKKDIYPHLEDRWIGKKIGDLWDDLSPEEKAKRREPSEEERKKKIQPRRLETIYRTNMRVANAAGHYQQLQAVKHLYPYWRYATRNDDRVREKHAALKDKVYPADDPVWNVIFPPNGFGCRCRVYPQTERQVKQKGLTVEHSNIGIDKNGNAVIDVGGSYFRADEGWDYNPGDYLTALEKQARSNDKGREPGIQRSLVAELNEVSKFSSTKQALLRKDIRVATDKAERVANSLNDTTLSDQKTIDKSLTQQAFKQGRKVLEFIRNYQSEEITDDDQQVRINDLTQKLQAAEHAYERLSASVKHTTSAGKEATKIQSELDDLLGQEISDESKSRVHQLQHRLHRLEQVAKAADNRSLKLEKYLEPNYVKGIKQLATDIAQEELRIHGITKDYSLKDRCSLEHCISSQEVALIDKELRGLSSKEAVALRKEAAKILARSKTAVNAATASKSSAKGIETLATSLRTAMQMRDLHEQAFDLRIKNLPESEQQRLREKRQKVLEDRQGIQNANDHIFDTLQGASREDIAIETKLMKRELDLMMYNMAPAELNLYRQSITARIAAGKNNYLFTDDTSYYNAESDLLQCNFRGDDPRNDCASYRPRFNWYVRFHEEAHCLDKKLSSDSKVVTFPNKKNSRANQLLKAIQDETLGFIKLAVEHVTGKPSELTSLTQCASDKIKTAVLDYVGTSKISAEEFATMLDALGLASHGVIDAQGLSIFYNKVKSSDRPASWPSQLYGHPREYNTRDFSNERHSDICDETSEMFADMTSVHWLPSDCNLRTFNERNLPKTLGICRDIMNSMASADVSGVKW